MPFPNITDYTASVENAASQVVDPLLKYAKPRLRDNRAEKMSGGMAVVFPFQAGTNLYAVKCWTRDLGDMRLHYQKIDAFLRTAPLKCFVEFGFVEKGIIANGSFWPILRMKWVGGNSLLEFVDMHYSDDVRLRILAERYLIMSQTLHERGVAHGDLQGSNMKVEGNANGINIHLIDYDTLVIPAYHGKTTKTIALPSYQHPKRHTAKLYTGKEDYFSELVIYLSLLAVAERPSLWRRYPKGGPELSEKDRHDKDMLFVVEDFTASKPTEVFKELFNLSLLVKRLTLILWNYTRAPSIEQLLPLEEAVKLAKQPDALPTQARPKSEFERLLESSTSASCNWLDDSAFVTQPSSSGTTKRGPASGSAGKNFDDWLREIAPTAPVPSADAASQAGTAPINSTQGVPFWPGLVVVGVLVFIAVLRINLDPNDADTTPTTDWRMESRDGYVSTEARQESVQGSRERLFGSSSINDENGKDAGEVTGYVGSNVLFPIAKPSPPPDVPILNVPSHRPLPSVPLPHSASQPIKPSPPDFSIYDASLLRFLQSEHPGWMAGLQQVPRPKYLGRLGMEHYLAVKFVQPDSTQSTQSPPWYAQMQVRDEQWQALSPAEPYQTKGALEPDFCERHPATLETIEGVVSTYIESLNSRRLKDLFSIYSNKAAWVERGSSASDRSVLEGNLRRTYQEWPRSRVDVSADLEIANGDTDEIVNVQFRTRFRMEHTGSGKWIEGTRSTQWQMIKENGWHVVREETSLVTPPYEGRLAKTAVVNGINKSPQTALPTQTRPASAPRLRVVNVEANDWLALRIIPDARAKMLVNIPHDATGIEMTGESKTNGQDIWVPVRWNGINGWAHGDFLSYE